MNHARVLIAVLLKGARLLRLVCSDRLITRPTAPAGISVSPAAVIIVARRPEHHYKVNSAIVSLCYTLLIVMYRVNVRK